MWKFQVAEQLHWMAGIKLGTHTENKTKKRDNISEKGEREGRADRAIVEKDDILK